MRDYLEWVGELQDVFVYYFISQRSGKHVDVSGERDYPVERYEDSNLIAQADAIVVYADVYTTETVVVECLEERIL